MEDAIKLHWCCGDIYLDGYINIDIDGFIVEPNRISWFDGKGSRLFLDENPNVTTLNNYFKFPFDPNPLTRQANKRPFVIDKKANVLEKWDFNDNSVSELVLVSCIEHFDPVTELPHVLSEIKRVIKVGGKVLITFPDIKGQVDKYYGVDDDLLMELIYCNHKNKYSIHHWGFTEKSFPKYLGDNWKFERVNTINYDYPMIQIEATKWSN